MKTRNLILMMVAMLAMASESMAKAFDYMIDENSGYRLVFIYSEAGTEATLVGYNYYNLASFNKTRIDIPAQIDINGKKYKVTHIDTYDKTYDIEHCLYVPETVEAVTIPNTVRSINFLYMPGNYAIAELRIPGSIKAENFKKINISGCMRKLVFEEGCEVVGGWSYCPFLESVEMPQNYKYFTQATSFDWKIKEYRVPEGCKFFGGFKSSTLRTLRLPQSLLTENEETEGRGAVANYFLSEMPNLENLIVDFEQAIYPDQRYPKFFGDDPEQPTYNDIYGPRKLTLWVPRGCRQNFGHGYLQFGEELMGKNPICYGAIPRIYEGNPDTPYRMVFDGEAILSRYDGVDYIFTVTQSDPEVVGTQGNYYCYMRQYYGGELPIDYVLPERLDQPVKKGYYVNGVYMERSFSFFVNAYKEDNINVRESSVFPSDWKRQSSNPAAEVRSITIGSNTPSLPNELFTAFTGVKTVIAKCKKPTASGGQVFNPYVYNNAILKPGDGMVKTYSETVGWNEFKHIQGSSTIDGRVWEFYDKTSGNSYYGYNRPGGGYGLGNGHSPRYNSIIFNAPSETRSLAQRRIEENTATVWITLPSTLADAVQDAEGNFISVDFSSLNDSIYYEDTSLRGVFLPAKLDSIGNAAFEGCKGLLDIGFGRYYPENPPLIGKNAFKDTPKDTRFWAPMGQLKKYRDTGNYKNIKLIGGNMNQNFDTYGGLFSQLLNDNQEMSFSYNPTNKRIIVYSNYRNESSIINNKLTGDVIIPAEVLGMPVEEIEYFAFTQATNMTGITIPASVTLVRPLAFSGCTGLKDVTVLGTTPPTINNPNMFEDDTYANATLWVPEGARNAYVNAQGWQNFAQIKEGNPTGIANPTQTSTNKARYYMLDGRMLNDKPSQKGLYIINGRKVLK